MPSRTMSSRAPVKTPRIADVYAGGYQGRARFAADLDDDSASPVVDDKQQNATGGFMKRYRVTFAASRNGAKLRVRFSMAERLTNDASIRLASVAVR
jgi:hypothetical protein